MKKFNFLIILSLFVLLKTSSLYARTIPSSEKPIGSVNGGVNCAVCTVVVSLVEQSAIVYNDTIEASLNKFCNYLPDGIFKITCQQAVEVFGPIIIDGLYSKVTPDIICHAIGICKTDAGQPECHILPIKKTTIKDQVSLFRDKLKLKKIQVASYYDSSICNNPVFKKICEYIDSIFNNHEPGVDLDKDGHSTFSTLRGTSWKGKDCNDHSAKIRPGFKPINGDRFDDSNCNGIYGKDPNLNATYEDLFCKNTNQLGVAVLGDSIGAHFHIPEEWIDATKISQVAFEHLAFIIENELDWPQLSATTGYMNNSWPVISGFTRSIYLNLLKKNKCNHRDYQNVAVNGANSGSMNHIVKTVVRNQNEDVPMLISLSLVGNDVCNGHPDTISHMTKPEQFYKNTVNTLNYLDTVLPFGSHVIVTGLANGSILYDSLGERIHPLGRVKNDIKYSDVYTYLTCLQVSPCNGWMTTNATLRNFTTNYALMLSDVAKNVTLTNKFKNFDLLYIDLPLDKIIKNWTSMGGETWQLIEPVDGFHLNQIGNALIADEIWNILLKQVPNWLGPDNIHNDDITKIFGDQGGH